MTIDEYEENVVLRLKNEDVVNWQGSQNGITIYLDLEKALSMAFHFQSIRQDRELRAKKP